MGKIKSLKKLEAEQLQKEEILIKDEMAIIVKDAQGKDVKLVYDSAYVDASHAEYALAVGDFLERMYSADAMSVDQLALSDFRIAVRKAASYLLCKVSASGEIAKPSIMESEGIFELLADINMKDLPKLKRVCADFFTDTGMSRLGSMLLSGRKDDSLAKIVRLYKAMNS